ncbi:ubiquitin-like-specific protease ESD4 [Aegilops tauschii subsp. strangulata]|uniref:ubiquitin-like-specific protease ESD4 n=1 Tax=Aegilops tauschii subsp. strangulata TaxID=200361 RepID=UPI003CC83A4E
MDSALSRAGAVRRVLDEYTIRDKSFIPLNVGNTHWITVVMHNRKKQFQVMDSLYPLDTVKALQLAISIDMEEANRITPGKYPDVTKWPITAQMDMPQQEDGNSCGLFVIEVMEHWDGERWTADFTKDTVNARRRRLVAELVLSPTNTLECVKNKICDIAKKSKA